MTACAAVRKGADERLDWVMDYADWIIDDDTIVSAEATLDPDLTIEPVIEGAAVRLWLSGGIAGTSYLVKWKITTAHGRVRNDCLKLRVK